MYRVWDLGLGVQGLRFRDMIQGGGSRIQASCRFFCVSASRIEGRGVEAKHLQSWPQCCMLPGSS